MDLREVLTGAVVMAPMTKGSNLPYRRLCVELGARVTISEMTVARRLKQRTQGRVRADPAVRGRAVLRRAAGRHQSRRARLGGGAGRIARRRSRRHQLRLPDRSLHAQGHWRRARPPARAHPPHRRSDEEGGDARSGDRQDAARLERRDAQRTWSRRRPRSTAAPTRCSCTAARATRATGSPPTGTPSARSSRPCRCRWSATATCCFRTTSTPRARDRAARA